MDAEVRIPLGARDLVAKFQPDSEALASQTRLNLPALLGKVSFHSTGMPKEAAKSTRSRLVSQ